MAQFYAELSVAVLGLALTLFLFRRFPRIEKGAGSRSGGGVGPLLSVIIPARNEEKNLPLLLWDLREQTYQNIEILCADDDSQDETPRIAASCGARVLSLKDKPEGWLGKSWACQCGARAARGELLLFLDADVRLGREGVDRLVRTYEGLGHPLSLQPYHQTEEWHEQLSLLFSLLQLGANGTTLRHQKPQGLYGPVILLCREDYEAMGGHEGVRESLVEDVALGRRLKEAGVPFSLFTGDPEISYRMYGEGLGSLLQGWTKNIAAGAMKTPAFLFWPSFFWISSLISVPLHLLTYGFSGYLPGLLIYGGLYLLWVLVLFLLARKIGRFQAWAILLFPIPALALVLIFLRSLLKKLFRRKVVWKGRAIR